MTEEEQPQEVVASQTPVAAVEEPSPAMPVETSEAPAEAAASVDVAEPVAAESAPPAEPSLVSLEAMEVSRPPAGARLSATLAQLGQALKGRGWIIPVALALLALIIISVPPVSLWARIAEGGGYTAFNADTPSVSHPDGLTIAVNPDEVKGLKVRLGSTPLLDFLSDATSEENQAARSALAASLTPKGPLFAIESRGDVTGPATLEVVIPNEAEPWETLDLYAWNGTAWEWVPTRLDRDREVLIADVTALPPTLIVMQSGAVAQQMVAETAGELPGADITAVVNEVDVFGMTIGTVGQLVGDTGLLPLAGQSGPALALAVRNWVPDRDPNAGLVHDMLAIEADRATHVQTLLALAQEHGYGGVVLDYRGLTAEDRAGYAAFVAQLASALHENGLWLAVAVDTPVQNGGVWNTTGYDWQALGAAADQIRVAMPLDPQAYAPGGLAEQLLVWGTTQVNRYKLYPIYATLSTNGTETVTMDAALPVATLQVVQTLTETVKPGTALTFRLAPVISAETDETTGATKVLASGQELWLGTPQWLRARLDMTRRYHLGGIVARELTDEGNFPGLAAAISDYQTQTPVIPYSLPDVTWQVTDPAGAISETIRPYGQAEFAWVTPAVTGTYRVAVAMAGQERGTLQLTVATPVVAEDDAATTATTTPTGEAEGLKAAFVSDVTVPDNTHFEKGEAFTKTWRLQNAGTEAWPENTRLVFESGQQMGETAEVEVGVVEPGDTVDISVDMVAPDADGSFQSVWRLMTGSQAISGGGVTLLIKAGAEPVAPAPAPGPITPVAGGSFEMGGHIRDTGFPYATQMHYAGMTWAKVQVHFGEDPTWLINAAHAQGFKIQLSALGSPGMVTEAGFEQSFASWAAGLAASGADAIEVWNEPNIDREWQIGSISPQAYTNLLCASYAAIKAANPGSAVISAAPAPTGYFGGCNGNGCDDQPWMEGLYAAGAANCMDYIGAHHNAGATSPSARSGHPTGSLHHSWYFLPQTELYYNIFHGTRKLFYTEMGYASQEGVPEFSDQFAWARGINNAQQAAWLAEAASLGASTGMVRCIIVWNVDFVRYGYDPQDGYAIIRPGGGCPACDALHNVLGSR